MTYEKVSECLHCDDSLDITRQSNIHGPKSDVYRHIGCDMLIMAKEMKDGVYKIPLEQDRLWRKKIKEDKKRKKFVTH